MNGPENYREAALILENCGCDYGCPHSGCAHEVAYLARAQVYAAMALTAAVIATAGHRIHPAGRHEWLKAIDPEHAAEQAAEGAP